ncbi:hypothetical protein WH95_02630 [Kiloniella litopenaei]|uniref:VWFA domain-containing protein n=1 Tax=Kiloniella litopenaei TaxID=1549748 RepID=A0A0M2RCT1_9PROT|nr:DUF5801 repeats-in-toxin domain-containing protein [Kiloniella litopenaei]KKJ78239.1 hypothetical protein WH95_02630 [Kiloniella litopenaei]
MTESFTNTGDENVSGEEGQDLLVGQAASVVEITAPTGGETKTVSLERGQTANLNFDATAATPVLEGNDFVLTFDSNGDGSADSRIVFQNLVEDAQGEDAPVLVIGGIELPAGLLIGQAQALVEGETLETAAGAGAGPQGGGGSTYDENLGDIIDLLQAQQALGGTGLEFGLLANGDEITDPAEGTFDLSFLTVTTDIPDDGGEGGETYVSGSFSGGFEDWQPNQHLGDQEEFPMQVEFNFTPADNETLDSVVIEALPEGVTLYIGGTDDADIFAGPFPVTVLPEDFDSVFILPPADSDADITVNATANISDPDSGESASIPATAVAVVDAAADKPVFNDDGGLNGDGLVDMYLLQDLTGSFSNDLANVRTAMSGLIGKIDGGEFSADVRLGVGSFKDKPLDPYGDPSDYVFQNAENVTDDLAAVQSAVDGFSATGGNDGPEGQIEALLNLAQNASDLGFRSGASKYVVLTTDNSFHEAGDASGLGANDGDGDLTADLDEDYPSLAQLKAAIEASGIIPVFMATSNVVSEYQALVDYLGVGEVHVLTSDSSNLLANILDAGNGASEPENNVYDEQAEVTVPVNVTFGDYTDGSEVHTIVLSGIPSDWIPTFGYDFTVDGLADGQNPGDIGLNTTYSITIDVTDLDDVGGLVDIDLTFNPQDWTSSRWSDGSSHDDGDVTIGLKAIAEEVNLSGDELTDLNNRAETDGSHTIRIIEDIPEVQGVTFTHDETKGVDAGSGDVATLNAAVAAALVASTVGVHGSVIGQAEAEVAFDFKTDGPTTPTDASDVGTEKLHFADYDSFEVPGMTAGGEGDENSSPIFLTRDDTNPNIVWGLDDEGNAVFSVHLEQPTTSSGTATMTFVQYQQINHSIDGDNSAGEHDDALSFTLDYVAIDGEGDVSDPATATITVEDDGPSIEASSATMDESDALYGTYSLFGADETVTIDVANAGQDSAGYHNTIGYYVSDADGNPIGGEIIQPDAHDLTSTSITFNKADYPEGATVGIFLIPNGDNQNTGLAAGDDVTFKFEGGKWVAYKGADALSGSQEPAYFSNSGLNPDGSTHVIDNGYPGNQNWEDLRNPKGDGDYNDVNLIVNVTGADPVDGCGVAVGQMTFDVGTDVVGHSFSVEAPTGVTSATETVTTSTSTSGDGRFITIEAETTGGDAVYTFVFDTTNGKYEFTQYRQLDHDQDGSTPADHDDLLALGFTVTLTDGDGDTASAVATINIDDDGPSAQADAIYTDETPGVQGNTDEIFVSDTPSDFPDLVDGYPLSIAKESLSFDFGKDKIGGKVDLTNADGNAYNGELSGLKDAATDQDIKLYSEDENTVVGRLDSGEIVFVAYMSHSTSSESADLYFAQYRGIEHPNTGSHDEDINLNTLFYTVTDGDGDTATANIRVNIDDDGPGLDNETANHLRESDLHSNGSDKVTGYFSGFYGADGAGSIEITDLKFVKDPDYAGGAKVPFTSGGKDIEFGDPVADGDFMVLTGVAAIGPNGSEIPVITLKVDNNGYYEIVLHEAVDHPDANRTGISDELEPHFEIVITDADGDTDTATLKFHITDDGVKAVDDTNAADAVQEDSDLVAVGNVLTNDDQGADGAVVTTTSEMVGTYGSVTINSDGSYTYTLNNGAANVQALADGETVYDTFTYRMEDADGDSDTAELKIKITGTNDAPVAVDDGVLPAGVPITGTVPDFELTKADSEKTLGVSFGAQNAGRQVTITFDAETGGSWDPFGGNQDTFTVEINGVEVLVTHDKGTNSYSFDVVTKDDGGIEIKFSGDITGGDESLTISNLVAIRGPGWPDGSLTTDENATLTVDVLANDTDVDNGDNPSTFSLDSVSFASGLPADQGATPADVTVVGNELFFEPGTAFDYLAEGETATVVVDYTMSDDSGASASATATIVVTGSNDAPVAVDDIVLTNVQGEIDIPDWALLQNDTDAEGDALTVDGVSNPVDGTVAHDAGNEVVTFTLEGGDVSSLGFGSGSLKTISEGSGDGYDYNWFIGDWVSGVNNNGFGALAVDLPRTEWAQDNSVGNDIVHKIRFEGKLKSARDYDDYGIFGTYNTVRKDADAFKVTLLAGEILSLSVLSSEGNPGFKLYSSSGVELDPDFTTGSYENTSGGQIEVFVRVEDNAPIGRDRDRADNYEVELSIDSTAIVTPATEGSFDYTAADGIDSNDANVSVKVQEGDTVTGTDADEILIGGDGDDTLIGGYGNDTLLGNGGNDVLVGDFAQTSGHLSGLTATGGDDVIHGHAGNDFAVGDFAVLENTRDLENSNLTGGMDRIYGGADNDTLIGDVYVEDDIGADSSSSGGSVTITGGDDYLDGGAGNDEIVGDVRNDDDIERYGSHTLVGGDDTLIGGTGEDELIGDFEIRDNVETGPQTLTGGNDQLEGGADNDVLIGDMKISDDVYGGNSVLTGGDDTLIGGAGDDVMTGDFVVEGDVDGSAVLTGGKDTFVFSLAGAGDGDDTITDFESSQDILHFSDVVDTGAAGLDLDDLNAMVSGIVNNGDGNDVVVNFHNGASITFQGLGSSSTIDSIDDLVNDPATQIVID